MEMGSFNRIVPILVANQLGGRTPLTLERRAGCCSLSVALRFQYRSSTSTAAASRQGKALGHSPQSPSHTHTLRIC